MDKFGSVHQHDREGQAGKLQTGRVGRIIGCAHASDDDAIKLSPLDTFGDWSERGD